MATAPATVPAGAPAASLALAPGPPPRRPRTLLIGSALAAGASALAVLTLVAAYLALRADALAAGLDSLPEGAHIPLTPGSMNMLTLSMSMVTAAWAVYALRNQDRTHAYLALATTFLLGTASIVQTSFLYTEMGLVLADDPRALLIYAASGAHIAMTVGGLLFLAVMGFQALGGQLTGRDAEAMSAATLYWYVTVAVYSVIWYGIYITK